MKYKGLLRVKGGLLLFLLLYSEVTGAKDNDDEVLRFSSNFELQLETRLFNNDYQTDSRDSQFSVALFPSLSADLLAYDMHLQLNALLRKDAYDDQRTHAELNDAYWEYKRGSSSVRLGYETIFWGKAEFYNLVDVINQRDYVELDPEAKLGQPMLHLETENSYGLWSAYALFANQESRYPGKNARLNLPIVVDTSDPVYEDIDRQDMGYAFRWSYDFDNQFNAALSYFNGIDRDPNFSFNFDFNQPRFIPLYTQAEQFGLELEYLTGDWTAKLEAIKKNNFEGSYYASVLGLEYSYTGVLNSPVDSIWALEYFWDERQDSPYTFLEHDVALGAQFYFNDLQSSQLSLAMLYDVESHERSFFAEFGRRFYDNWHLNIRAFFVHDTAEQELSDTVLELYNDLSQLDVTVGVPSDEQLLQIALDLIKENGLGYIFEFNTDPKLVVPLQQIQGLLNNDEQLSFLENDDFIQFQLSYFF